MNSPEPILPELILYDYWRSGAAYRVRIALELKGFPYRALPIDLLAGEQLTAGYRAINPQGLVPTLETGGERLAQSGAILEWLEEVYPKPPLLPQTPLGRQIVRAMAATVGCDIHPLNNLRVLKTLRESLHASEEQVQAWIGHWIHEGCVALERMVTEHGGAFAYGDHPTLADCYLAPQFYSAERFKVDLSPFPILRRVVAHARAQPAFQRAYPTEK